MKSQKWFGHSPPIRKPSFGENGTSQYPAWMTQKPRKGRFRELNSKPFLGRACPQTPLEACAFGACCFRNRSQFILDPRLLVIFNGRCRSCHYGRQPLLKSDLSYFVKYSDAFCLFLQVNETDRSLISSYKWRTTDRSISSHTWRCLCDVTAIKYARPSSTYSWLVLCSSTSPNQLHWIWMWAHILRLTPQIAAGAALGYGQQFIWQQNMSIKEMTCYQGSD